MKQFLSTFILITLLLGGISFFYVQTYRHQDSQHSTPPSTPAVKTVFFPKGNETLIKGRTYIVKWTEGAGDIQIFLIDKNLQPQGESVSIVDQVFDVSNTGSYTYSIPKDIPDSTYIFKIDNVSSQPFKIVGEKDPEATTFCNPSDIQAQSAFEGAAGSVYGTLTITNTSATQCHIQGNQFIKPQFTASAIEVIPQAAIDLPLLVLQPQQTVYSQIRYTNGAQCSGPTKESLVSFSYAISPSASITFKDSDEKASHIIPTCQNKNEMTELLVWGIFDQPVTK